MVAAARRGNGDLVLRKTVHQRKTQAIFSRCTSSRQVGTAADLCGDCILWLNLSTGSRVRQGGGQPPNARFVTEEKNWLCRSIPISDNGFSGFGEKAGEEAGVARGMRIREEGG